MGCIRFAAASGLVALATAASAFSCGGEGAVETQPVGSGGSVLDVGGGSGAMDGMVGNAGDATSDASDSSVGGAAGSGGYAGSSGSAGTGPCGSTNCGPLEQCWNETLCVARLVSLPEGFLVDATEVTRSQYESWLATKPWIGDQEAWCAWNTSFVPDASCMSESYVCKANCGNHPQVCIDWCDAYAYCKAVGKRLCGSVWGGPIASHDLDDPGLDHWYKACSSNGAYNYAYGGDPGVTWTDGYDAQKCNGWENAQTGCSTGSCTTLPVGALSECQSPDTGYAGIYDMSGNVWEWQDSCDGATGQNDPCYLRGGSFRSPYFHDLLCSRASDDYRYSAYGAAGLRCCAQ